MRVKVNDVEMDLDANSTVEDAIRISNAPYIDGSAIALIEGRQELESHVNKYKIETTNGSIIIELVDEAEILTNFWKDNYKEFIGKAIRWTTSNEVAMGSIVSNLEPSNDEFLYNRWDVIISLSGFSNEATHIIFSKSKHKAIYGVPEQNKGIVATIVGGKRTISQLKNTDKVLDIKPIIERKSVINSAAVTDFSTQLHEGNELFTYIEVEANPEAPTSFEHFLKVIEDGTFKVDYESESFIGNNQFKGLEKDSEIVEKRKRGSVTLRNQGNGVGRVYIYREDRVSVPTHNIIGYVTKGIQILDTVNENETITVLTNPQKISTIALTQKESEEYLESLGFEHERDGLTDDDAVIVAQDPNYTVEISQAKKVKTLGVPRDDFVEIELYEDKSPSSVWYFRKITGLLNGDVGHLRVDMAIPSMDIIMFQSVNKEAKGLIPELLPDGQVNAWEICVSNTVSKHVGNLGIRFSDNKEFGPTGESFKATNVIGKIISGFENLKAFKEGDTVYVKEQ
ncbi:MAG: methanogenesis marker 3 protein [Methanosphaera sp.]|nr:methanogenesis marker 3 protein [Methanosphaera sp.]